MSSFTGAEWAPLRVSDERVAQVRQGSGLSDVAARCLAIRLGDRPLEPGWLEPSLDLLHDPFAMLNLGAAVDRLHKAIRDKEKIRVVTDYDVDGTTSSLILQAALKLAAPEGSGAIVDYHIPNRFDEGYGFSAVAARKAAEDGIGLIVTADIGVRDQVAVTTARDRGLDVLICDHHLPRGALVPEDATVLCPPQIGCGYPNPALAACGISLKLGQALIAKHPKRDQLVRSMLKLAAIGTVADMVPLSTLENRAIVALGLRELNRPPHTVGLAALLDASGLTAGNIDESSLGFRIGPRINAAGRIADAKLVVELLTSRDVMHAVPLAKRIDGLNTERRDIQHKLVEAALQAVGADPQPFVVVAGPEVEGWHRGVVGIVASRLKDDLHRPVAVVSVQGDRAVGSIRSIPSVHAVKALDSVADLLEKYGGHPAAAGFTVPTARLDQLRERLCAYVVANAGGVSFGAVHDVDAEVDSRALDERLHGELERLGPFGQGNARPRLSVANVRPEWIDVKANGALLKFELPRSSGRAIEAVWWDHAEHREALAAGPVDLLGELKLHRWGGGQRLQIELVDVRRSI